MQQPIPVLTPAAIAAAAVLCAMLTAPVSAIAATPAKAAAAKPAPRMARLAGIWDMQGYKSSRSFTARQRVATDVKGAPPPLQPWAAEILEKRLREADDEGRIYANNAAKCLPQGLPYMIFAAVDGPIQIIEEPDQVTILSTEMSEHWLIFLNAKHPADFAPNYHGHSVGHWEGDTLVVDTIGLAGDKTTIDQVGTPHSDDLHLVTRMRRSGLDDLSIRMTITDPKAFTRPFERQVTYRRAPPGIKIEEYVCESLRNAPDASGFQSFVHERTPRPTR